MWKDFEKREKLLASLEEEHMATRADIAQMKTIGCSSSFSVALAITSEQEQMVKRIDYCTDILVNEPRADPVLASKSRFGVNSKYSRKSQYQMRMFTTSKNDGRD